MKRFRILLPILSAALAVVWMSVVAARPPIALAQETWAARSITDYRAVIRYYDGTQNCTQDIEVEEGVIISVQESGTCTTPIVSGIEHPTITDIMDYLTAQYAIFEDTRGCRDGFMSRRMAVTGRYDHEFGYPRSASIAPTYFNGYSDSECMASTYRWINIEVTTFIPS